MNPVGINIGHARTMDHNDLVREAYKKRADHYDDGWHDDLANDFVKWVDPKRGEFVLDLACGTGLVTRRLAARVGQQGRVVAVDLTKEMIDIARAKDIQVDTCDIDWLVADITSETLLTYPSIKSVIDEHGGFDIISVCSALVLLPDQHAALTFWAEKLLKKGGRVITDVPTESITLQLLMTCHLPEALGRPNNLAKGRLWIKGQSSLESLYQSVSLHLEQSIATRSYTQEIWYAADEETALKTLRKEVKNTFHWVETEGKLQEAEKVWPKLWDKALTWHDGAEAVDGGHRLYVCVGRKTA